MMTRFLIGLAALSCMVCMSTLQGKPRDLERGSVFQVSKELSDPKFKVEKDRIIVWRYYPPTPCEIGSDNPPCANGDGVPDLINGTCEKAVCSPLSAAERVPANKKMKGSNHLFAGEGDLLGVPPEDPRWNGVTQVKGQVDKKQARKMATARYLTVVGSK
jgi:hypothetical protein